MAQKFLKNKKGAVGIGTLIIFIALVLVAAVAASVIINTAGKLQHKAATVGEQSTEQVASGLQIIKIIGHADTTNNVIDKIGIIVSPNVGGEVDLATTLVTFSDGSQKISLVYAGDEQYLIISNGTRDIFTNNGDAEIGAWPFDDSYGTGSEEVKFGIIVLQDGDGSLSGTHPTLNYGDKAIIAVNVASYLDANGIAPRSVFVGEVIPEFGASGIIDFRAPSVFNDEVVTLQ